MKKSFLSVLPVFFMVVLLLWPSFAYQGAKGGLLLWANVVLPAILPFMICSNAIVALGGIPLLIRPFRILLHKLFRLSENGSYVLVSGLLCGYPLGAKTCSDFLLRRMITGREASYLLAISNHPSPMFVLGYVTVCIQGTIPLSWLLFSLYLPVLPISFLAGKFYGIGRVSWENPFPNSGQVYSAQTVSSDHRSISQTEFSFDRDFMSSLEVMMKIGGYMMLFSVLASYVQQLPLKNQAVTACLLGLTEMTTGLHAAASLLSGDSLAIAAVSITAFGGFSGIFQTKSVIKKNAGLLIRHYIIWKAIHAVMSGLLLLILLWYF